MSIEEEKVKLNKCDKKFDLDDFFEAINCEFGSYQIFLVILLCIPTCFIGAYSTVDVVFMAYTPKHLCNFNKSYANYEHIFADPSLSVEIDKCNYTIHDRNASITHECKSWTYDTTYFDETIVTRWNLVCTQQLTVRSILTLFQLGSLLSIVYSFVQDRWGRKRAFSLNLTIYLMGSFSCLLSTNPVMFTALKFIGSITGMWRIGYVWALEFVGRKHRTTVTTMIGVTFGVAVMSMALIAYLCHSWIEFGLCTTVPFVLLYSYLFIVPESPRWLLAQGRIDQTVKILARMARWQKVKIDLDELRNQISDLKDLPIIEKSDSLSDIDVAVMESDYSIKKFFASSNLRLKCFLITIIIVASNQLYYAVPFHMENFEANFYLAFLIQAAVETPSTFFNLLLLNRFGRIKPLSIFLFMSGMFCLMSWPAERFGPWGPVTTAAVARFFVCIPMYICEQQGSELFPTVYRGTRQAVSHFFLSIVMLTNQYIIYSSHIWNVLPLLIMGGFTILTAFLALFLPETKNVSLPDSISEAELQSCVGIKTLKNNFKSVKFSC